MHNLKKQISYIPWYRMPRENLVKKEFNDLYVSRDPKKRIDYYTKRVLYDEGSWAMTYNGYYCHLYTMEDGELLHYWTNVIDDNKNHGTHREHKGRAAISTVERMFKEKTGVTLKKAFGYVDIEYKLMSSPKQLYYTNDKLMSEDVTITDLSMVDFTAHYPSSVGNRLPDAHTAIECPGTVAPTEEYPFAFYMKSGHLAEYGVFDTHDWVMNKLFDRLFVYQDDYKDKILVHKKQHPFLKPEEDTTILMKASQYSLGPVYEELYERRKEDEEFKNAMNRSIGYMATASYKSFKLAHIRAVIIARANAKMLEVIDKIGLRNIIQVCVDGAAYVGNKKIGIDYKAINTLHQEFTGAVGRFSQLNCYIVEKNGEIIKVKHGCFNGCSDGSDIDHPTSLDDIKKWRRTKYPFEEELHETN